MGPRLSIGRKLPLLICGLLAVVIAAASWAAYHEVRAAALLGAGARLQGVTRQLGDMLQNSARQRLAEMQGAVADPVIRRYSQAPRPRAPVPLAVAAALRPLLEQSELVTAVELWDSAGRRVAAFGSPLPALGPGAAGELRAAASGAERTAIGRIRLQDDTLRYSIVGAVRDADRARGYVVQRRRLSPPDAARQLARLIGSDAALYLGNRVGDVWTDFTAVVETPPVPVDTGPGRILEYERSAAGWRLAQAAPIQGTPWVLLVEFPRDPVLGPARRFLSRMGLIALVLVALGGTTAWALSRRITTPLRRLTAAAEGIAAGEPSQRVPPGSRDELGRLAASFNIMAERVEEARRGLEAEVAERTRELREATEQLERTSEERYRHLFHRNPLPMWVYDQETLAFLDVNEAAIRHYGWSREEFLGMTIKDIRPPDDVARLVATLSHVPGGLFDAGIWRHRKKDGSIIDVEVTRHHLQIGGRAVGLVLAHDVTARLAAERALRESEEALRRLNAELEQRVQQRTADLESFSYSISHDLRAPLRAIDGFSRILLEDHAGALGPEAGRLLEVVRSNTQRMGQLIDDLLAFSRLGRREPVVSGVDMTALAQEVAGELRRAEGDRAVEVAIAPLAPAHADAGLLRQVWVNLIGNALKFTRRRPDARVEIGSHPDGRETVYYVRDNGAGFDMRYAEKLFGVFQRLHRLEEFEGTGVGLAIVQRVVQRHGGRVWAEGRENEGATFYFSLPREATAE